ncbi:MAG: anthranilate synthase component I family protein [Bacteroidales bacterium]
MERVYKTFPASSKAFKAQQALRWGGLHFEVCCYLNSNHHTQQNYPAYDQLLAIGAAETMPAGSSDAFEDLKNFSDKHQDWLFGYLSYDLKNQLEDLDSSNHDGLGFAQIHFFRPVILIIPKAGEVLIGCLPGFGPFSDPDQVYQQINAFARPSVPSRPVKPVARVSKARYLEQMEAIHNHIHLGDIYEMNYCVEFFDRQALIDPYLTYGKLNKLSPTPYSVFYKLDDKYLMCASPERFLKKQDDLLISQPIKGTAPRGATPEEDRRLREDLFTNPKERSENVMIVDLVRNDLSKVAEKNSVAVAELFGIYSFATVHQMISTVTARLGKDHHFIDALRHAFPMGSMTGAPKVRAMQLIEQYEDTRRGLFSGAVGYISPDKDFDFNVVIRSILYNQQAQYLAFLAGSAITAASIPEQEYQEVLIKAQTMMKALE